MMPHRATPLKGAMAHAATWQWLTALWERSDPEWRRRETFDHLVQASGHDALGDLVWMQARMLRRICPSGEPTPAQWAQSWQLSHHVVTERRVLDRVRQLVSTAATDA